MVTMLSTRAQSFLDFEFKMEAYFKLVAANPYDETTNPNGIIDMGSSTNGIVSDLIMEKLTSVDMNQLPSNYFNTCEVQGPLRFREKMAGFFNHYIKPNESVKSDDIFIQAGAGSVFESVGFALLNPGDAILLPKPYYYQFDHEFSRVSGATLIPFPVTDENCEEGICTVKKDDIECAYSDALSKGLEVKMVLLVNPNNPMGYIFHEDALKMFVEFCYSHNLHLVSDEIYMHCVFGNSKFQSILNIPGTEKMKNMIHIIWAFSKEFAVAGFRIGTLITQNQELKAVMNEDLNKRVSNLTLFIAESLITDFSWLNNDYFPKFQQRLRNITDFVKNQLKSVHVYSFPSNAGLFVWVNFKEYADKCGGDMKLFNLFMDNKIYVSPGIAFKERKGGWFRVITSLPDHIIKTGIDRIIDVVKRIQ